MTAPGSDEQTVAELAEALRGASHLGCEEFDPNDPDSGCPDCGDLLRAARALLPVIAAALDAAVALGRAEVTAKVEALHSPIDRGTGPQCQGCATHVTFTPWPCKTITALRDDR